MNVLLSSWNYPAQKLVRIYRIQHRSEVYSRL